MERRATPCEDSRFERKLHRSDERRSRVEEPVYLYVVGTAGSGKTKFTAALARWMQEHGHDAVTVNLDPGAEDLPYAPDVDIRDWVVLADVMAKYGLGPNGAQVVAADMLALQAGEVKATLETFRTDYVILDTPGQTELFVFRESGKVLMDALSERRAIAFLVDPYLATRPSAYVSQLLLSATTQFRCQSPVVNVLTKADLLKDEQRERLDAWSSSFDALADALASEQADLLNTLNTDVFKILDGMGAYAQLTPVSSETLEGLDDVYALVQATFAGGEDLD
jgi:GTPase SAR1 family protein